MRFPKTLSGLATLLLAASSAVAQEPVPVSIAVFPPNAQINTIRDRQSIVVQATYADGITRDVTKAATALRAHVAGVVVLTTGADGGVLADDGGLHVFPALPVPRRNQRHRIQSGK